jgi:hypothetical protein
MAEKLVEVQAYQRVSIVLESGARAYVPESAVALYAGFVEVVKKTKPDPKPAPKPDPEPAPKKAVKSSKETKVSD